MYREEKIPGIMIAAVKSGSGKTTITCALLEALKNRGFNPASFKCGPDYIDPMFHRKVINVPSYNLDSFFCESEQLQRLYLENAGQKGIAVVEAAMGLFDGLGGISEAGSAYEVASILKLPILLVVDAHGMGRSVLALLAGFQQFDREKRIAGVILNKTPEHFYQRLAPVIERELRLPVFGFLPKNPKLGLESRHLGLKLPGEISDLQKQTAAAAELLEQSVSIDRIVEAAHCAGSLKSTALSSDLKKQQPMRIGVAKDEAFCFYYEENLRLLEAQGAQLVYFSPLHEKRLPEALDGLLLGGGYPELYAKKLEKNTSMRQSIRQALESKMPSLAECGGFMYLHESLEDQQGQRFSMCGVLPGKCFYTGKLVRFGYMELTEKQNTFLEAGTAVRGHEFHYYDSENNGTDCTAQKPVGEKRWDCVQKAENHFWGFPHLYYPSNPGFVEHFIEAARLFRENR